MTSNILSERGRRIAELDAAIMDEAEKLLSSSHQGGSLDRLHDLEQQKARLVAKAGR